MANELQNLIQWFASHCDGEWEHTDGIRIETLDNPGWSVRIDLEGTDLEHRTFAPLEENYEHDLTWIRCWVKDMTFHAACGPRQLQRVLQVFLTWAEPSGTSTGAHDIDER